MPTLRELLGAIQQRPGVQTVVLLGADGLVIETHDRERDAAETVAARVPAVSRAAMELGRATAAGDATLALLEFERGYGVVLRLSAQVLLFVATTEEVALGELLFDLRRHRAPMAALV